MNKLQTQLLDVLNVFDEISKKHGIEYGLYGGTFLGAVRHKGFIPWDDDVDVILKREDYDKLIKILSNESNLPENYFFQSFENSRRYANSTPKIRSNKMDITERMPKTQDIHYGPWIDLFVWDNMPEDIKERKKLYKKLKLIDNIIFIFVFMQYIPERKGIQNRIRGVIQKINELLYPIYFFVNPLIKYRYRLATSFNNKVTKYKGVANYNFYKDFEEFESNVIESSLLDDTSDYIFENETFTSYKNFDEILKKFYGDYMTPPNVEDQVTHNTHYE